MADTWLKLDISTPSLPNQIMKLDKVDYERLKSDLVGRFFARESTRFNNHPIPLVHTRIKDGRFHATASPGLRRSSVRTTTNPQHRIVYIWIGLNDTYRILRHPNGTLFIGCVPAYASCRQKSMQR